MSLTPEQYATSMAGASRRVGLAVEQQLIVAATRTAEAARRRVAPHDRTGHLRGSVHADVADKAVVFRADASYASFVDAKVGFVAGAVQEVAPTLARDLEAAVSAAVEPR